MLRISDLKLKEIDQIIAQNGFLIEQFRFELTETELNLFHKDGFFFFKFMMISVNTFQLSYSMPYDLSGKPVMGKEWSVSIHLFTSWLKTLKIEISASDNSFKSLKRELDAVSPMKHYSNRFVKIYEQTLRAEKSLLDELVGMGYRKSLEFLIKDYIVKKQGITPKKLIHDMRITLCIEKYIEDVHIQILSKRITWLGNDHTHYTRIWKNKNIEDIKNLLHEVIKWILMKDQLDSMKKSVNKVKKNMPDPKRKTINSTTS